MRFKKRICIKLIVVVLTGFITSCSTINVCRIKYDDKRDVYMYRTLLYNFPLRNNDGSLVTKSNYNTFLVNLADNQFAYNFNSSIENDFKICNADYLLAQRYSSITTDIKNENFNSALNKIDTIQQSYSDIVKYSDMLFLKGLSYEKLNQPDSAGIYYTKFITLSAQKYSSFIRCYKNYDTDHVQFINEKNHAKNYLLKNDSAKENILNTLHVISPKYYFSSFSEGFVVNPDDLGPKSRGFATILFGADYNYQPAVGFGVFGHIKHKYSWFPYFLLSNSGFGAYVSFPLQIFQHPNNKLGVKLSPIFTYNYLKFAYLKGKKELLKKSFANVGLKLSTAYYFNQNVSFGAHYQYFIFNADNPYTIKGKSSELFYNNEYDLSLYYRWNKVFGLKTGVRNGGPELGIVFSVGLFAYNFKNKEYRFIFDW